MPSWRRQDLFRGDAGRSGYLVIPLILWFLDQFLLTLSRVLGLVFEFVTLLLISNFELLGRWSPVRCCSRDRPSSRYRDRNRPRD